MNKYDPTLLIRPTPYGLLVAILSGFFCNSIQLENEPFVLNPSSLQMNSKKGAMVVVVMVARRCPSFKLVMSVCALSEWILVSRP